MLTPMMELDAEVGSILKKIDDLGIADNTIVVFTSDNGAETFSWPDGGNSPFRGEKGTTFEGGFRVPMLAKWPGTIKPGRIVNDIIAGEDFLPTFMAAGGDPDITTKLLGGLKVGDKTFKTHLDGYNFMPFLKGDVAEGPRKEFFYFTDNGDLTALRYEDWKLSFKTIKGNLFTGTEESASPGSRTTGTQAASFLVTPPGWTGAVPSGLIRLAAPTPYVWVIGRTKTDGPSDYDAVEPGKTFDFDKLAPAVRSALESAPEGAQELMKWKTATLAQVVNGWSMNTDTMGVYGNYYLKRAIVSQFGLGANLPEDAIYPLNLGDNTGKPLDGANKYVIHFAKGGAPPVDAFWSITLYDAEGFQVGNTLNRFAVASWMPMKANADGSLDIYFQNESPGPDKETNWLPAPKAPFNLTMRLYGPRSEALTGKWSPPPVTKSQ
jgi:hypothetical protein